MARPARALRRLEERPPPPPLSAPTSTRRGEKKADPEAECIGKSKGGPTTKIHATCDALGNPTTFHLTPGQAHDLNGADVLLPGLLETAGAVIADKAYDVKERVVDLLEKAGVEIVIPSKSNAVSPRDHDRHLYKRRHLIENFFCRLKQYRALATRYSTRRPPFSAAPFTSPQPSYGSFDDTP